MTQLVTACGTILSQLEEVLHRVSKEDFTKPSIALSQATLGQHLRHTLEFFICLENGYEQGVINYDKRDRDHLIENDKFIALAALNRIAKFVEQHADEKELVLEVGYEQTGENWVSIETTYRRELVYNIEHAVHHMAIMKIGIREVAPYIQIPDDFGVAVSTLRFKQSQTVRVG
jgi:hypothetical protein